MGTETTSASYRRTQTHESQNFSTELLKPNKSATLQREIWGSFPFRQIIKKGKGCTHALQTRGYPAGVFDLPIPLRVCQAKAAQDTALPPLYNLPEPEN